MGRSGWAAPFVLAALAAGAGAWTLPAQDKGFLGKPLPAWVRELADANPAVRRSAAFALGKAGAAAVYSVPRLVRALKDPDAGVREAAAFALGEIGPTAWDTTYPALVDTLTHDGNALVRRSAAFALGRLGQLDLPAEEGRARAVWQGLEKALGDPEASVRQNAAWALGRVGPKRGPDGVPALCRALADRDALVRRDAAGSLGEFGPTGHAAVPALLARVQEDADPAVRKSALGALVSLLGPEDKQAAGPLRAALQDADSETARSAALALAKVGGPQAAAAVPILCEALHDRDAHARRQAAGALARIGPDAAAAVANLAAALSDRDPVVRRNAALALGGIGEKAEPAVPGLADLLASHDEPVEVRLFASQALAQISPAVERAIPALLRVVQEESDQRLRQWAALALGQLPDPERAGVLPALLAVLAETGTESRLLRYDTAVALGVRLGPRAPDRVLDVLAAYLSDPQVAGQQIQTYVGVDVQLGGLGKEAGPGARDTAVRAKYQGDARFRAALALARIGRRANRPDIIRGLKDAARSSDARTRQTASEALRRIQN